MTLSTISSYLQNAYLARQNPGLRPTSQAQKPTADASPLSAPNQESTSVTLSSEALEKSRNADMPAYIRQRSEWLRNHPNQAEAARYVERMATSRDDALVSLAPDSDGVTGVYYKSNGAPVTEASKAWFSALSETVQAERTRIYSDETARGTSPAGIYDKIQQYMATMPESYLHMACWYGSEPA